MIITVTSVGEATQEVKGKRQWSVFTVKYTGDQGDREKVFRSFSPDWNVGKQLEVWKSYDIKLRKDGSFWVWEAATESDGKATKSAGRPATSGGGGGNQGYWDERFTLDKEKFEFDKEKQPYIVRQSSLSTAVDYFKIAVKSQPTPDEVIEVAKRFEEYVFSKGDLKQMEVE